MFINILLFISIDSGVPVLPLYINLYSDGFGIYKRKYHSTKGVYMCLGNQPRRLTAERRNMYVLGLAEPGMRSLLLSY